MLTQQRFFSKAAEGFRETIAKALSLSSQTTLPRNPNACPPFLPKRNPPLPSYGNRQAPESALLDDAAASVSNNQSVEELWKGGFLDPSLGIHEKRKNAVTGDAWPACLLRMKSFEDLHKLWFVCLKEKNLLLGERWAALQQGLRMERHGRIKKVKMTMKRILTVLSRREIHQQGVRAKQILAKQQEREELETRRHRLEESMLQLQHKLQRMGMTDSLTRGAWLATLEKHRAQHQQLMLQLAPLRKETMQLLAPDWRYQRRYSDLPGPISWTKERVPALDRRFRKPIKVY